MCNLMFVSEFAIDGFLHLNKCDEGESLFCDKLATTLHKYIPVVACSSFKIYMEQDGPRAETGITASVYGCSRRSVSDVARASKGLCTAFGV